MFFWQKLVKDYTAFIMCIAVPYLGLILDDIKFNSLIFQFHSLSVACPLRTLSRGLRYVPSYFLLDHYVPQVQIDISNSLSAFEDSQISNQIVDAYILNPKCSLKQFYCRFLAILIS
jgi:hypothetical protein